MPKVQPAVSVPSLDRRTQSLGAVTQRRAFLKTTAAATLATLAGHSASRRLAGRLSVLVRRDLELASRVILSALTFAI